MKIVETDRMGSHSFAFHSSDKTLELSVVVVVALAASSQLTSFTLLPSRYVWRVVSSSIHSVRYAFHLDVRNIEVDRRLHEFASEVCEYEYA